MLDFAQRSSTHYLGALNLTEDPGSFSSVSSASDNDQDRISAIEHYSAQALRDRNFEFKTRFSVFAKFFDPTWRESLFAQLDQIFDPIDWEEEEPVPSLSSWETCLRLLSSTSFAIRPGLSLHNGSFVLVWRNNGLRCAITCLDGDRCLWSVSEKVGSEAEYATGECSTGSIGRHLLPYNKDEWLYREPSV